MLLNFTAEERALLASVDAVMDIPPNTKPSVARKIYDNTKRLVNQLRGLAPVLEARGLGLRTQKKMVAAEVRDFIASQYPAGASFEEVARWRKAGYNTDTINALHLSDITIRQGAAFEVQAPAPRYQGGQAEDPTDGLRDAVCDASTQKEHTAAAEYHRALARKATSLEKCSAHYQAADLHDTAARLYPDLNSRFAACAASKSLKG
jgi:hypothetical protein